MSNKLTGTEIAIIGLAGRYPRSKDLEEFWRNLREGRELISFFTEEEAAAHVDAETLKNPNFVRAASVLEDMELFDASFFGFMPREAEILDPQQRLLLECAWSALENAGYAPERYPGLTGVYVGAVENTYLLFNLVPNRDLVSLGLLPVLFANGRDYMPTRVSYKLNLRGPSCLIQSACSTSLVAIHTACQSLLNGECDMALAGGVSVMVNYRAGYTYLEGGVASPDGHCRTFDAKAQGTIFGSGVGLVVLKPLETALNDGDTVHAIIRGSALNNDGSLKVNYTAPSVNGQAEVIIEALANAGVDAETISYVEAHGTATALGDTIEIQALTHAFRKTTNKRGFCAIGSVKTNVGHLDAAAGVTGVIKTVLALKHREIPASLHFEQPNPKIDFASSPFRVNTQLCPWPAGLAPRRAGVSSFGIGGTNAHLILEEAPPQASSSSSRPRQVLVLSAKSSTALETATTNLFAHLKQHPDQPLANVAYTLQVGRTPFSYRRVLVCQERDDAIAALEIPSPPRVLTNFQEQHNRPVIFMFPGQGTQHVNMTYALYQYEPTFRKHVDDCAARLKCHIGIDLRQVLYPKSVFSTEPLSNQDTPPVTIDDTYLAQPALFVVEYALARLWMSWGVQPKTMIGHSIGEYVAACLADVFSLDEALALVVARGHLMQGLLPGAMLAVSLSEAQIQPLLGSHLSLAAINTPSQCVISGPIPDVEHFEQQLTAQGVRCRRLRTSHAFHSSMMDPILDPFVQQLKRVRFKAPQIPYASNLTGTLITASQATNLDYWRQHLRHTIRFSDGLQALLQDFNGGLLEVGPGQVLNVFARQHLREDAQQIVVSSLPHPQDGEAEEAFILNTIGQLWLGGVEIDWAGFYAHERRHRVSLCTYPFERKRYWIAPPRTGQHASQPRNGTQEAAKSDINGRHTAVTAQQSDQQAARQGECAGAPIDALPQKIGPSEDPSGFWSELPLTSIEATENGAQREANISPRRREMLETIIAQQLALMSQQIHILQSSRTKRESGE